MRVSCVLIHLGGSAGANLAAALSYALTQAPAKDNFPPLHSQILISPMLQALDFRTPSYQTNNSDISHISREDMIKFWQVLLNMLILKKCFLRSQVVIIYLNVLSFFNLIII